MHNILVHLNVQNWRIDHAWKWILMNIEIMALIVFVVFSFYINDLILNYIIKLLTHLLNMQL